MEEYSKDTSCHTEQNVLMNICVRGSVHPILSVWIDTEIHGGNTLILMEE